jgi:uncharacterized membrane protein
LGLLLGVGGLVAWALSGGPADPHGWDEGGLWWTVAVSGTGVVLLAVGLVLEARRLTRTHATPATFLSADEEDALIAAIRAFETKTSGELRIHLENHVEGDLLAEAKRTFAELGLTATRERNGVLFFIAVHDHRFAVLGDQGIDQKVPQGFWDEVVTTVKGHFAKGRFGEGLVEGVTLAGEALATHFPPRSDDRNELSDELSRG